MRNLKLPKYKMMSKNKRIGFYNKPKLVYIPLISGNDTDLTIVGKKGDYIYKGSIIGKRKGDFKLPIKSSVSGTVIDYVQKTCSNGTKVKCVVIENDFKEKEEIKDIISKKMNQYTKEDFINIIKDCGVIGMGKTGYPTYLKYETTNKIDTLIVNCVECSPYVTSDYILLTERCEDILETIDAILEINEIDNACIAISKKDTKLLEILNTFIGTYLKIKIILVDDGYPMGWERNLVENITKKTYDETPMECGVIVNNVSTIYAICEALKYNKPLCERIITFTGDGIRKPQNVYVKIGTPIIEIINKIGVNTENYVVIAGEPMMGKYIEDVDNLVATADLSCVIILSKHEDILPEECIRCGKCVKYCPAKISPVLIKDNENNKEKLSLFKPEKCISCGLCSYICPSKIDLRSIVEKAGEK